MKRGRLHGGTLQRMETEIITAWQEARRAGKTVALMANRTETVTRLNRLAQKTRIVAGELDPTRPHLLVGQNRMLMGDEVVTRRNHRRLRTNLGFVVKNRDHWTITTVHPDGSVTLTGGSGRLRLPADYTAEHLQLGYAQTSHASQGPTVDVALLLVDGPTDSRGIYTPMTRGRETNHAYVVADNQTAREVLTQAIGREWIDQPAVARIAQLDPHRSGQAAPAHTGDQAAELERRVRRLIEQRRLRTRAAQRSGPALTGATVGATHLNSALQ